MKKVLTVTMDGIRYHASRPADCRHCFFWKNRMKLEAIERTAGRPKNVGQVVPDYFGKRSTEVVAEGTGESYKQVQRFIRLTNLIPELLDMVDEKKISFNPAVELSYLDKSQQRDFLEAMNDTQNAPSLSQAQRLKKLAQEGHFSYDVAFAVMGEEKKRHHRLPDSAVIQTRRDHRRRSQQCRL